MIVGDKIIEIAIRAIAKKFKLTKILEYVENPNELDKSVERLFRISQALEKRIGDLETYSHPKRNFVVCDECKQQIKEK
tara:strand:- start:19 stop:255 length:237 start_codon:yes stop_codon:yes gene_type:complete